MSSICHILPVFVVYAVYHGLFQPVLAMAELSLKDVKAVLDDNDLDLSMRQLTQIPVKILVSYFCEFSEVVVNNLFYKEDLLNLKSLTVRSQ